MSSYVERTLAAFERLEEENEKLIVKLNAEHIARQNVEVDNAKLREQSERLFDKTLELGTENAKLRELVRDMFEEIEAGGFDPMVERQGKRGPYYEEDPSWRVGIRERMRELGIEES